MNNTGIILTLAYPETIVMVANEWYSPYMRFIGIGKKNYVRAGHAALVLINIETGLLEYHDFGRYITPEPNGRVRGKTTDHELDFPLKAEILNNEILNLDEILKFLAIHPKLTHGDGKLIASVCDKVDYQAAREHITMMQERHFIRYAAFVKDACNCARFVTGALIASVTDLNIKEKLIKSTRFTPSTIGNVTIANTKNIVYEVSEDGDISEFKSTVAKENRRLFLDKLIDHEPCFIGTIKPKPVSSVKEHAQWLSGIAAGAWFELHDTNNPLEFRFRRVSPSGYIDVEGVYQVNQNNFNYNKPYEFIHYSNCNFFHIMQDDEIYRFDLKEKLN
ncbi:MAG: hypothetical protein HKO92_03660 [Flavobacteriaceae bacterium]|nr:hypothetical protein [Flavobacteriaceae bacterium]